LDKLKLALDSDTFSRFPASALRFASMLCGCPPGWQRKKKKKKGRKKLDCIALHSILDIRMEELDEKVTAVWYHDELLEALPTWAVWLAICSVEFLNDERESDADGLTSVLDEARCN